jgi:hypothetical protein
LIAVVAYLFVNSNPHPSYKICEQIRFENRKIGDVGNDCMLSVDGTDFRVAKSYEKPLYSYKFKKSGLRYEVALCIKTGDICWTAGLIFLASGMII